MRENAPDGFRKRRGKEMNGFSENVRPIVDSIVYREKAGQWPNALRGQFPFVTISRQSGAGGHTLALAVMEELKKEFEGGWSQGWQVMDQEICRQVAEDPAVRVPVDSLLAAEYHSELEDILKELFLGYCSQDAVIRRMLHLIRDSATFGKVILVGRGASCLTRDLPMGVHIRLVASFESRLRRMRQSMNINEKQARNLEVEIVFVKQLPRNIFHCRYRHFSCAYMLCNAPSFLFRNYSSPYCVKQLCFSGINVAQNSDYGFPNHFRTFCICSISQGRLSQILLLPLLCCQAP